MVVTTRSRLLALALLAVAGCSEPAPVAVVRSQDAGAPRDAAPPAPVDCRVFLAGAALGEIFGPGEFHNPVEGRHGPYVVDCQYRVTRDDDTGTRATVLVQAACGHNGRQLRRLHAPRPSPGDRTYRPLVGYEAFAVEGPRLGAVPQVRMIFESATRPGCQVRVEAPGEIRTAVGLAQLVEKSLYDLGG